MPAFQITSVVPRSGRRRVAAGTLCAAALAAAALTAGCGEKTGRDPDADPGKPVVIVNDDTVTVAEAARYVQGARLDHTQEGLRQAIEDLIAVELVKVAAQAEKLTREQEALKKEWEDQLLIYEFRDSVIFKGASVPDSAIQAYYRNRFSDELKARHVLISVPTTATSEEKQAARRKAEEAVKKARAGEDFAELSRRYSEPTTAKTGGDLGWFTKGDMVPAFERAAFELEPGEVSDIVETRFGFHVIKVEDRRKKSLEEVRDRIEQALGAPLRAEAEERYLETMMGESKLEFHETNVDSAVAFFRADSLENLSQARRDLPLATWDKGRLTVGDIVERYEGLPDENKAAVRALDRNRMLNALAPLVKNQMLLARAREQNVQLAPDRRKKLDERMQGMVVADMLRRRVKEQVAISDSAVSAAYRTDSASFGTSLKEAEPAIRRKMIDDRLKRANTWAGQLEMIRDIAKTVEKDAEVQRVEGNYDLVIAEIEKLPVPGTLAAPAGGAATAEAAESPAGSEAAEASGGQASTGGPQVASPPAAAQGANPRP